MSDNSAQGDTKGKPGEPSAAEQDDNQWAIAVDRYRDVAKWLIAAFAAIGAIIAGTAPLAGIGNLDTDRLGWLVFGGLSALTGVAVVLTATVSVLIPRAIYRHELHAEPQGPLKRTFLGLGGLEDLLANHPKDVLPAGITTLSALDDAITNLRRQALQMATRVAALPDSDPTRPALTRACDALATSHADHATARLDLLHIARFESARTRFHQALIAILAGGLLTAIGLAATLYAIGSTPADTTETPNPLSEPIRVTIALTPDGAATLRTRLGAKCPLDKIPALLLAGDRTTGPWDIITTGDNGCTPVRLTLPTTLGTLT